MIDNRIRFDAPLIDFPGTVGLSGQTHDNFPAPNQQARFDWMRMFLIGLLSCQSSNTPPSQYRLGTPWFDLTDETLKIRTSNGWSPISEVIKLDDAVGSTGAFTLQDWYNEIKSIVGALRSEIFFQGKVASLGATLIPIPTNLIPLIQSNSRPFVYVNGVLVNPATTTLQPGPNPTAINVPSGLLTQGSEFVVVIKFIPEARFNITTVTV